MAEAGNMPEDRDVRSAPAPSQACGRTARHTARPTGRRRHLRGDRGGLAPLPRAGVPQHRGPAGAADCLLPSPRPAACQTAALQPCRASGNLRRIQRGGRWHAGRHASRRPGWHTDGEDKRTPDAASFLYALQLRAEGGVTIFSAMYAAYNALPAEICARIQGRRARFTAGVRHGRVRFQGCGWWRWRGSTDFHVMTRRIGLPPSRRWSWTSRAKDRSATLPNHHSPIAKLIRPPRRRRPQAEWGGRRGRSVARAQGTSGFRTGRSQLEPALTGPVRRIGGL